MASHNNIIRYRNLKRLILIHQALQKLKNIKHLFILNLFRYL